MAMFSWEERYRIGVPQIDAQHKRLFEISGRLHEAMMAGHAREALGPVLDELIAYTRMHFRAEEKLMEERQFPDRVAHRAEHDALTRQVLEFQQGFAAGKVALTVAMMRFLKDWLVDHIGARDQRIAAWLRKRTAA